jgi:hypothetical protein
MSYRRTSELLAAAADEFFARAEHWSLSQALACAEAMQDAVKRVLSQRISKALNEYLATQSQETYSQKQSLADALQLQLEKLGLAVKHPATGGETSVYAVDTHDGRGLFQFASEDQSGIAAGEGMVTLPQLELTLESQRRRTMRLRRHAGLVT